MLPPPPPRLLRASIAALAICAAARGEAHQAAAVALGGDAATQPPAAGPTLYVYLHTFSKSGALEAMLAQRLRGVTVTVFGRFRDFEEAMAQRRPDAVLALGPCLTAFEVRATLQGMRGKSDSEPYVLVSTGAALEGSLDGKMIGLVDLLGREGTQRLVSTLLGAPGVKLKRVTKLEDLLPLLQFEAADAVLMPAAAVKAISERSRLSLIVRELPNARLTLPALGVVNDALRESLREQFQGLDGELNSTIGVERWRAQ